MHEVGGRGRADGGVDLILTRGGQTTVVQVKHRRRDRVGVQLVRELYGVQRAMQADHAMFVVSMGRYTADAVQFAAQIGMTLYQWRRAAAHHWRWSRWRVPGIARTAPITGPMCPACGGEMVRRIARRGPSAGHEFFGCARFPACQGTVPIPDEEMAAR